ncbi:exo-alpha-sialidase [Roseivivax sp. GX 12232]|uniref:WD40/YVTN/BNR-like repeat-containing protein n=1 Tax=Roseivivax sp. GX 12232 TaxID=2900547 RepID=UPI001E3C14F2|nr:sialidase family protein [Roseivivax sp. GX 12232]MCE0505325.1 exo-alpha-sialidase [Roseivivax sp. GX 12232]
MAFHLLVGTTKGAFILTSEDRAAWSVSGPHCDGWPINHMAGDAEGGTLWAGGGNDFHGAGVFRSEDGGATWTLTKLSRGEIDTWLANDPEMRAFFGQAPAEDAPFGDSLDAIWSLHYSQGTLYAGAKPATLAKSTDGGTSWTALEALTEHPTAKDWAPGAAGLTLHTILSDPRAPEKLWVGISAAGVFASEDGGASWDRRVRRANTPAATSGHPAAGSPEEIGLCVHNMVRAPSAAGDVIWQQNHHGTFRSADGGRSWEEAGAGLPSTFGFPIAVHPADPETAWVLPLNGDMEGRFPPGASAKVWKTSDGGASWSPRQVGLPERDCFFTVLRQAMATDREADPGVYFGTNSGSVFGSRDGGESWEEIARHLPTVLCVEAFSPGPSAAAAPGA